MKGWKSERVKMILAFAGAAMLIYVSLTALLGERAVPTAYAQQDQFLARRIDQLEQRFISIESRLNRLESDSRRVSLTPSITRTDDTELNFLRLQVDSFRLRIGEVECGLLRLDERTLTPAARTARSKAGASDSDKCRVNFGAPVQLSARP